jgi:hypothetical protein
VLRTVSSSFSRSHSAREMVSCDQSYCNRECAFGEIQRKKNVVYLSSKRKINKDECERLLQYDAFIDTEILGQFASISGLGHIWTKT